MKKIIILVMSLMLSLAYIPPKPVQAGFISDVYNAFINAGNTVWQWLAGDSKATGGGGVSRGGGAGRFVGYHVDDSYAGNYTSNIKSGTTVLESIIDPYDRVLNLPGGVVTNVDTSGGGGVTRGGGAGRYPIDDIAYNPVTNEYTVITNNYTYIVEPAPLYTQITYDVAGQTIVDKYYYELPDGRTTWDLKEEDIFGLPLLYEYVNYKSVPEDDGTMFLNHFDGDTKNVAFNQPTFTYSNPTYNYSNSGNFNQALVWTGNESLSYSFNPKIGEFTSEMRFYVPAVNTWVNAQSTTQSAPMKDVNGVNITGWGAPCYSGVYGVREILSFFSITLYSRANVTCNGANRSIARNSSSMYMAIDNEDPSEANLRTLATGVWHTVSEVVTSNRVVKVYLNGSLIKTFTGSSLSYPRGSFTISNNFHSNGKARASTYVMIDELRLTNRVLHTSNHVPSSSPFTTNNVFVLPDDGNDGTVAIKSNIPVSTVRWGGVKPTYPQMGALYLLVNNDIVTSIQQYDGSDWLSVDGGLYDKDEWHPLNGYNISRYINGETDYPTSGDNELPLCTSIILNELPNGVKDEYTEFGKYIKRVQKKVITQNDLIQMSQRANYTHVQLFPTTTLFTGSIPITNTNTILGTFVIDGMTEVKFNDNLNSEYIENSFSLAYVPNNSRIYIQLPLGTSLEQAKNLLSGKIIFYQLLNPIEYENYCKVFTSPVDPTDPSIPSGFLGDLINGLGTVFGNLFNLTGALITSLTTLFTSLFVPEQQEITNTFDSLQNDFDMKIGFLKTPFDVYESVMGRYLATQETDEGVQMMSMSSQGAVISIPQIIEPFTGITLIQPTELSFSVIVEQEPMSSFYNFYLIFIDVLCFVWVINLARRKYDVITSS